MALQQLQNFHSDRPLYEYLPLLTSLLEVETTMSPNDWPGKGKQSLPSISHLIEAVNEQANKENVPLPNFDASRRTSGESSSHNSSPNRPMMTGSPRNHFTLTPELPPASSFDFPRPSPANISPLAGPSHGNYHLPGPVRTNPELYAQRTPTLPPVSEPPLRPPPPPAAAYPPRTEPGPWTTSNLVSRPRDAMPPDQVARPPPMPHNERPMEGVTYGSLTQQRPLPTDFPGPLPAMALPPIDPALGTWQHHHYYPPANPPSYPQTQERYICPSCNKPFSRPSSLKIHTYSHTGEKPYKCKHEGCNKRFSVRSNMKRHEKGCHGGGPNNGNTPGPSGSSGPSGTSGPSGPSTGSRPKL